MKSRLGPDLILTHSLLLGERLYLFARLRFAAAAAILLGGPFASYVLGVDGLDLGALAAAAGLLSACNVGIFIAVRRLSHREESARKHRLLVAVAHLSVTLDYIVLTYAIWLVGGALSPFLAFYLLHAILAAVLLSRAEAYGYAAIGYLFLSLLVLGQWSGAIPRPHVSGAVPPAGRFDGRLVATILFVYGLLTLVTTVLTTGMVKLLRQSERGLRSARERLEHLADIRRSFLHVVLHDVRSPVGTAVAMLAGLESGIDGPLREPQARRIERARQRLQGALELLRNLRVLADLATERLEAMMAPVDVRAIVRDAVDDQLDAAEQRRIALRLDLPSTLPAVRGIERLIREAIANYLTNAIKYTPPGGQVVVRVATAKASLASPDAPTRSSSPGSPGPAGSPDGASGADIADVVRVEVIDGGPGITREAQAKLFQEFARGPGAEAAGRTRGIGLGLSIVRRIAEEHGGRAGVVSEPGQGSTFFIEFKVLHA